MNEFLEVGLDEILFKVLEREYLDNDKREIELITAQLEVLDFLVLEHSALIQSGLETKIELLRDELLNVRSGLLQNETKKRMVNAQLAWSALKER